jgi:hypothetical protein
MVRGRLWWIGVVALLAACGTDDPGEDGPRGEEDLGRMAPDLSFPVDQGSDQGTAQDMAPDAPADLDMSEPVDMDAPDLPPPDMTTPDMAPDMEPDLPPPPTCADMLNTQTTFDIDAAGEAGQYYSRTAFDGDSVWIVYNRPESPAVRDEALFIARLGCDGSVRLAPTMIGQGAGFRDLAPSIAVGPEHIYVAYNAEERVNNTQRIMLRVLRKDGSPVTPAPVEVTPTNGAGQPISTLVWEPDIAALPSGTGALIVASAAVGSDATFQIAAQRVDLTNARDGEGFVVYEEKGVEQHYPALHISPTGLATVAWTRGSPFDAANARVVTTTIAPGATSAPAPGPANPGSNKDNQLCALSKEVLPGGKVFLAFQTDQSSAADLGLREVTPGAPLRLVTMGSTSKLDLRPTVSVGPTTGVVGWLRANTSPVSNLLILQPFDHATGLAKGAERTIQTATPVRPPFGPGITHVTGSTFFVTWSEGATTPTARVKGRFITL